MQKNERTMEDMGEPRTSYFKWAHDNHKYILPLLQNLVVPRHFLSATLQGCMSKMSMRYGNTVQCICHIHCTVCNYKLYVHVSLKKAGLYFCAYQRLEIRSTNTVLDTWSKNTTKLCTASTCIRRFPVTISSAC